MFPSLASLPSNLPSFLPSRFPSLSPSECRTFAVPDVVDQVCVGLTPSIAFPVDAITITDQGNGVLNYVLTHEWIGTLTALAIRPGVNICSTQVGLSPGNEIGSFEGECILGIASVTVVAYFTENIQLAECVACNVDLEMEGDDELCSYVLEIPCEPVSYDCLPSSPPTEIIEPPSLSPSNSPSLGPSLRPTNEPTAPAVPKFACTREATNCLSGIHCAIIGGCGAGIIAGFYPDLTRKDSYCKCTGSASSGEYMRLQHGLLWDGFPNSSGQYLSGTGTDENNGVNLGEFGLWGTEAGSLQHVALISGETKKRPPWTMPSSAPTEII